MIYSPVSNKKAQITLFVVLGIIIVALLIGGFYYRDLILSKLTKGEIPETVYEREVEEVKNYVDGCMIKLAEDAVDLIGLQGGYIELPEAELAANLANPLKNRLTVLPGLETAYWFYDEGNGIQKLNVPTVMSMQNEIARYIDQNLFRCTGDFSNFENKVSYQKPKTEVEIKEDSIIITMKFPVSVEKNDTVVKLDKFSVSISKPLGRLYTNAKQILETETRSNFLEEKTLDLFVVYDEIPYSGVNFECTPRTWSRIDVLRNIKNVVSNNIQHLKIKGTNYGLADENRMYFEVNALKNDDERLNVNFMFSKEWPMLIDVLPDDPVMKSESYTSSSAGKFLAQFFCLNYYNFVYSVRYPVLISLTKDSYTFQFATQVIIDHNQPKENKVDVNYFEGKQARVCEHPMTRINVNVLGFDKDGNLKELNGAKVSFKCLGVVCDIGYGNKELVFPQCVNGLVIAEKGGYNRNQVMATTVDEQELSINLEPIYERNLSVLVTNENGGDRAILGSEIVLLQFEEEEQDYAANVVYPYDRTIKLIAGNYNVRATIISNLSSPLQLKEEKVRSCTKMPKKGLLGIIGMTEKKCIENIIPGVVLSQVISGGEELEFSLNRQELADSRTLIVYAIKNKMPGSVNDIPKIMENIAKNKENKYFKMPVLR